MQLFQKSADYLGYVTDAVAKIAPYILIVGIVCAIISIIYSKTPSIKTLKRHSMLANGKVIDEYKITSMIKPICENIVKYRIVNDELRASLENARRYDELYIEKSEC